jgi:hypothetical protein
MTYKNGAPSSDSVNLGSNPSSPATTNIDVSGVSCNFDHLEQPEISEQKRTAGRTKVGTARRSELPDLDRLREVLDYDADTGVFTWRVRLSPNGNPGTRAGTIKVDGYRRIGIDGVQHAEHRLAWLYHYGTEPPPILDHLNTLKDDNRIANLRPATMSQNAMNRNARSRFKGVKFQYGRYHASIRPGGAGKRLYLGSFATAEEAYAAYSTKAAELHGNFRRLQMSTFETRQQLRAWAHGKPDAIRNHVSIMCQHLWMLDRYKSPTMRGVVARGMEHLHALKLAAQ